MKYNKSTVNKIIAALADGQGVLLQQRGQIFHLKHFASGWTNILNFLSE